MKENNASSENIDEKDKVKNENKNNWFKDSEKTIEYKKDGRYIIYYSN